MTDQIDVNLVAVGGESVDHLAASLERLSVSMDTLAENSAAARFEQQMAQMRTAATTGVAGLENAVREMKAVMATGFADISATNQKLIESMGASQARAIEVNAEKAAQAITEGGLRMKAADARTWEQIQRGSATNVTAAFNQLAQGIPVEAVEARFGKMAASTAASLDGQLEKLRQFQENAKSLFQTSYRPMAGATEDEINRAHAMNASYDAKAAADRAAIQQRRDIEEYTAAQAAAARLLEIEQRRDVEIYQMRSAAAARLSEIQQRRDMEEYTAASAAAARMKEIEERRDVELHQLRSAELARMAEIQQRRDMEEYTAAQNAARRIIEIEQRRDMELHQMREAAAADAAAQAERQRVLNTSFMTASPASQLRTATQAQVYAGLGGDATARYGSAATSADINALRAAHDALAPAAGRSRQALEDHNNAMREAHSLARGLAGSLGGLWLTYGSMVPIAAGAAIAASLKQVVSVGADVEHQLTNVLALTKEPVNLDTFLKVSDGSLRSLSEGANAMRMLAQNGLNATQSLQVLPAVLDLATAGEMTVGQAALAATGAASAFGLGFSEAGRIADIFAVTAANSNTSVLAMTESMKQASTVASLFKVSIEETAGMLGLLAKINVTGGAAGTSLTNMLTGLYEPTDKGKRALKELGVETHSATGALKPLTELLGDLRSALSGFNDSARVDLLGSIFTVRGVKSAQLALDNINEFKQKTEEAATASGFMAGVVRQLEDDATGGFQRLSVTVQNSFVRSFREASPFVQRIALQLGDMFRDGGTASTGLQNFSTNVARMTGALVENLDIVATLAAGYVGWRMIMPAVVESVGLAITATSALTTAQVAETAALGAVTAANLGAGASSAQVTAFVTAQATATEAATAATAAWEATLLPILGAVGIAVGVAAAAWLLFRDNTSEADRQNEKLGNSLHVIGEALDREIEQLQKANKLWDERNNRYMAPGSVAPSQIEDARALVKQYADEAAKKGLSVQDLLMPKQIATGTPGVSVSTISGNEKLAASYRTAAENLRGLLELQEKDEKVKAPAAAAKKLQDSKAQLEANAERFFNQGMQTNSNGEFYQKNEQARAISAKAADIAAQITDSRLKLADPAAEMRRIDALNVDLKQLEDQRNAVLGSRAEKPNKDDARARIEELQEELRLRQMLTKSEIDDLKSENKRGELGDLQLINQELEKKVALDQFAAGIARQQAAAAATKSQRQKYMDAATTAEQQVKSDQATAARAREDLLDKMAGDELQARAKALESQGRLEDAYNLTWTAKHKDTLTKLSHDIEDAQNGDYKDALVRYKNYLEEQRRMGANDARFKEGQTAFSSASAELDRRLAERKAQSGPGTGLSSRLSNIAGQGDDYAEMLPQLQAARSRVSAASSVMFGADPAKVKAAESELKAIQDRMAAMRNVGVEMGDAIAKALTDAFGKGGQALGGMIVTATSYDAKMKEIQATLDASGNTEAARKKAADDTASAQIKAYGDMAGSAKGFFDTNSAGYRVLAATEKAFRVLEVAQAASALAKKLLFKGTEVTATVAGDATKAVSGTVATAVDVANAGTSASAWGVAAVAKAIASLPFPLNLAAGAATVAALVAVGVKMMGGGGGGGGQTQAQKEQENHTGTVLGDRNAQSESIAKSLEMVKQNTYNNLPIAQGMLNALLSIESNMGNFVSLLFRDSNVTGSGQNINTNNGLGSTLVSGGITAIGYMAGAGFAAFTSMAAIAGPLGAAVGFLASKIPFVSNVIGKIGNALFGGKQSIDAQGFMLNKTTLGAALSGGVNAQSYADIHTSGGLFSHSHNDTQTASLGAEANSQITKILDGMGDTITSAAGLLGMSGAAFTAKLNSFVIDLGKINLKDLSSSDAQAKINAAFSKLGDQMAQFAVGGLEQFQQAGEGYLQTLTRVAVDYATVDTVFKSLGTTYQQVGVQSIAAREQLIALAGGLDKFTSNASWFFQNMMTTGQQTAATRAAIEPTLQKYGLSSVGADAVKRFTDLTIQMGAMGSAGAQAYTELMNIAQAFKSVTDVATDLQQQIDDLLMTDAQKNAAARAKLDPQNQALYDQLQQAKAISQAKSDLASAYESESQALQSSIDKLKSFSTSLRSFVTSLQLGSSSLLNPADKYGAARTLFDETLSKAKSGDATAQGNLQSVAQQFLQASRDANASNSTYQSDYQKVTGSMLGMADLADTQVSQGEASLNALHAQISQLTTLNTSTLSVLDAVNNLAVAMTGGQNVYTNRSAVQGVYQELLGHGATEDELVAWSNRIKAGLSLTEVIDEIKHTDQYTAYQNAKGQTNNTTPSTSYGTTPVPSSPWTSKDPYAQLVMQSDSTNKQLAALNAQVTAMRQEAQVQTDQTTTATMTAGANTGAAVSTAITRAEQTTTWTTKNRMQLR